MSTSTHTMRRALSVTRGEGRPAPPSWAQTEKHGDSAVVAAGPPRMRSDAPKTRGDASPAPQANRSPTLHPPLCMQNVARPMSPLMKTNVSPMRVPPTRMSATPVQQMQFTTCHSRTPASANPPDRAPVVPPFAIPIRVPIAQTGCASPKAMTARESGCAPPMIEIETRGRYDSDLNSRQNPLLADMEDRWMSRMNSLEDRWTARVNALEKQLCKFQGAVANQVDTIADSVLQRVKNDELVCHASDRQKLLEDLVQKSVVLLESHQRLQKQSPDMSCMTEQLETIRRNVSRMVAEDGGRVGACAEVPASPGVSRQGAAADATATESTPACAEPAVTISPRRACLPLHTVTAEVTPMNASYPSKSLVATAVNAAHSTRSLETKAKSASLTAAETFAAAKADLLLEKPTAQHSSTKVPVATSTDAELNDEVKQEVGKAVDRGDLVTLSNHQGVPQEYRACPAVVTKVEQSHCTVTVLDSNSSIGIGECWPGLAHIAIESCKLRLGTRVVVEGMSGAQTKHLNGLTGSISAHPREGHPVFIRKAAAPDKPQLRVCVSFDDPEAAKVKSALLEPRFLTPYDDAAFQALQRLSETAESLSKALPQHV